MKYVETMVVFREVPDEVTLAINISNCPVKCPGCHSSYLAQDIGEELDKESLAMLVKRNPGISCVSFMGGDAEPAKVGQLAMEVKKLDPSLKTCWYSGRDLEHAKPNLEVLDFVKVGPYIEEMGPLDSPSTNQRFYKIEHGPQGVELTDMTGWFRKKFF